MIRIIDGVVRATDSIDLPLSAAHELWKTSKLDSMLQFGEGVTVAAMDDEMLALARRAQTLSSAEKEFWACVRSDRDRLKRVQDSYEETA